MSKEMEKIFNEATEIVNKYNKIIKYNPNIMEEIEAAEKKEKEPEEYALHCWVSVTGCLVIGYNDALQKCWVGYISEAGECYMLENRLNYETWLEKGMKVDSSPVEWRGKEYCINSNRYLRSSDELKRSIYCFRDAVPCAICGDSNIKRYSNGTPILH